MSPFFSWRRSAPQQARRSQPCRGRATRSSLPIARPRLESLEDRVVLDTRRWINPAGGLWSVASNWQGGVLPGPNDDAVIDIATSGPVTHAAGTDAVHRLTSISAFTLSGGTLSVSDTVEVSGPNASFTLSGGTLSQATVTADTTITGTVSGGTLDHVTLDGEIDLFAQGFTGASVTVTNGLTLNGIAQLSSNFFGAALVRFQGTQTLDGTGTIFLLSGPYSGRNTVQVSTSGSTLTIGAGIAITGAGDVGYNQGEGGPSDVAFVNQGTLTANVPGGTLTLAGTAWSNAGLVQADGATLTLTGTSWSNAGAVRANSSTVNLAGTNWTNDGTVDAEGSSAVNLGGTMANAASTGSFAGSGFFTVSGVINGGTLDLPPTAALHGGGGTLNAVTVNGAIDLSAQGFSGSSLNVTGGLTLNGTAALNDNFFGAALLNFLGSQSFDGTGTVVFGSPAGTPNAVGVLNDGSVLTIGPGITIRGNTGTVGGSGNVAFINRGTITADVPGGTVTLEGTGWGNVGVVAAKNGGTLLAQGTNTNFADGTLVGGSWQVQAYSTLRLLNAGIVTNAAAIDLEGLSSNWYSDTGTTNGLAGLAINAGSFGIGLGRSFSTAGPFTNVGTVTVGNSSRFSAAGPYRQLGGATLIDGGILAAMPLVDIEGGSLAGWGTILANVRNAGELDVGAAGSAATLTIQGDYTQTAGVLSLGIGTPGPGGSDRLAVTGQAVLGGTLNVTLLDGFAGNVGDGFQILTFGSRVGDFATASLPTLDDGMFLEPVYDDHSLTLVLSQTS